jgi:hypothetical protein
MCIHPFLDSVLSAAISFLQTNLASRFPDVRTMILDLISCLCELSDDIVERCALDRNVVAVLRACLVDIDLAVRASATGTFRSLFALLYPSQVRICVADFFLKLSDSDDAIRSALVSEGLLEHTAESLRLTAAASHQVESQSQDSDPSNLVHETLKLLNVLSLPSPNRQPPNMSAILFLVKFCCTSCRQRNADSQELVEIATALLANILELPECPKALPEEDWISIISVIGDLALLGVFSVPQSRILASFSARLKGSYGPPSHSLIVSAENIVSQFISDRSMNSALTEITVAASAWIDGRSLSQQLVEWLHTCAIPIIKSDFPLHLVSVWINAVAIRLRRSLAAVSLDRSLLDCIGQSCRLLSSSGIMIRAFGGVLNPDETFERASCCMFASAALPCLLVSLRLSPTGALDLNQSSEQLASVFLNLERGITSSSLKSQSLEAVTQLAFCALCCGDHAAIKLVAQPISRVILEALATARLNGDGFGLSQPTLARLCAIGYALWLSSPNEVGDISANLISAAKSWRINPWSSAGASSVSSMLPPLLDLARFMLSSPALTVINKINLIALLRCVPRDEPAVSDAISWLLALSDNLDFINLIFLCLPSAIPKESCEREQWSLFNLTFKLILEHPNTRETLKHDISLRWAQKIDEWSSCLAAHWHSAEPTSALLTDLDHSTRSRSDTDLCHILQVACAIARFESSSKTSDIRRHLLASLSHLKPLLSGETKRFDALLASILSDLTVAAADNMGESTRYQLVPLLRHVFSSSVANIEHFSSSCATFLCIYSADPDSASECISQWENQEPEKALWDRLATSAEASSDPITCSTDISVCPY